MKTRILLLLSLGALSWLSMTAQTPTFGLHDKVLNLGVGIGGYNTSGYNVILPPLSASFEIGVSDKVFDKGSIGIGGYIAYGRYKENAYSNDDYWTYNKTVIGVRGNLHYPFVDNLDTYAGLMLGYKNESWEWHGNGSMGEKSQGSGMAISLFVGGRYYFTPKFAAMAELGMGICILNLGVAWKF